MKNLSAYAFSIAALVFLLSSCGSISIEKRRYRPGFYISTSNSKAARTTAHKEADDAQRKVVAVNKTAVSNHMKSDPNLAADNTASVPSELLAESNSNELIAHENRSEAVPSRMQEDSKRSHTLNPLSSLPSTVKKKLSPTRSGDALSFIWLLILIVLLIWLIAFVMGGWGLGGFVHLFLLIAAILLILWLLRII